MNQVSGRDALLSATITVVARGGLRSLTHRAVALEAGVSHGLVRHHFGSRDALIEAALEYAVQESMSSTSMTGRVPSASGFAEGIDSLAEREADMQAFQYELLLEARRKPELRPLIDAYYETYRRASAERLRELGVVDQDLAEVIWFALDGLVFKQLIARDAAEGARALERIRALVAAAASAGAAPQPGGAQ